MRALKQLWWVVMGLALAGLSVEPAHAASLKGTVTLPRAFVAKHAVHPRGYWKFPNNVLGILPPLRDARRFMVIVLEGGPAPTTNASPEVRIADAQFTPPVLAVQPGAIVRFTNTESALHLLESRDQFRGKRVGPGDTFDHKFAKVGTYRVHCSEMPHLIGTVLVTPHHAATPDNRGDFSFDEVPAGSYKLRVWYADKWIHSQPVTIRGKTSVQVQIAAQQKE